MISNWARLNMAAFIQEADDVYAKNGALVCVKDGVTRIFALDELPSPDTHPKGGDVKQAPFMGSGNSSERTNHAE